MPRILGSIPRQWVPKISQREAPPFNLPPFRKMAVPDKSRKACSHGVAQRPPVRERLRYLGGIAIAAQLSAHIRLLGLSVEEKAALAAFLRTL